MNELNINILRSPEKSHVRIFLGIIYITLAVLWLITRIILKDPGSEIFPLPFLNVVYILLFGVTGIVFIIEGSGISIAGWFGEAYIKINGTGLYVKKGVFKEEWNLLWSNIEQVEYKLISILFTLADKSIQEFDYDNLDYGHIQSVKQAIRAISEEKGIKVISHN